MTAGAGGTGPACQLVWRAGLTSGDAVLDLVASVRFWTGHGPQCHPVVTTGSAVYSAPTERQVARPVAGVVTESLHSVSFEQVAYPSG